MRPQTTKHNLLSFRFGNAKLDKSICTFSLPSGHTCPFAKVCLSKSDRATGKITDGPHCKIRCFSASQECVYPAVRASRWHNFDLLREASSVDAMALLIQRSLPRGVQIVRDHVAGDFFNEQYFRAWLQVAQETPQLLIYAYTKAVPFIVKYRKQLPANFRLTASKGGTHDALISKHHLKFAEIVLSVKEAQEKGLPLDHDDSLAMQSKKPFALLVHGTQKANSPASKAVQLLKKQNLGGYSREHSDQRTSIFSWYEGRIMFRSKAEACDYIEQRKEEERENRIKWQPVSPCKK